MFLKKLYSPNIFEAGHRKNDPRKNDPTKQDESDNDHTRIVPETEQEKPEGEPDTPQRVPGRAEESVAAESKVRFGLSRPKDTSFTFGFIQDFEVRKVTSTGEFGFNPQGGRRLPY